MLDIDVGSWCEAILFLYFIALDGDPHATHDTPPFYFFVVVCPFLVLLLKDTVLVYLLLPPVKCPFIWFHFAFNLFFA